ncbi:unnamed protein product [Larinioides sclopetarius]|uniref:Uncharacterized protein n=1 Tax=Larinioides sclopetarius TaxID=280406 RepID=A0AAV1ZRT1_9ARAC
MNLVTLMKLISRNTRIIPETMLNLTKMGMKNMSIKMEVRSGSKQKKSIQNCIIYRESKIGTIFILFE